MTSNSGDQAFAGSTAEAKNNSVWWDAGSLYADVNGDDVADFGIEVLLVGLSDLKATNIVL